MEALVESLSGLAGFALYFVLSLLALIIFKTIYSKITPHKEWQLVKENNVAAACGFAGSILGYSIAIAGAASNSVSPLDFILWAVVALVAQLVAFGLLRLFMPKISQRIQDNEIAAGIMLGGYSIAIGVINAACMSY
ncbi:MAG: hypothetical protein COC09_05680 [Gammaproteobacteria bacterium]|nr:MAG: hypothetical protein COC09_05680 [Gammaproteobacteria bacterium]